MTRVDDGSAITDGSVITVASSWVSLQVPEGFTMTVAALADGSVVGQAIKSISLPISAAIQAYGALTMQWPNDPVDFLQFSVVAQPTVSAVSPANGPLGGGTPVTITGVNFFDVSSVKIGGNTLDTEACS